MLTFPDPSLTTEYTDPNGAKWEFNGTGWVRQHSCPEPELPELGGPDGTWPVPTSDGVFALTTRKGAENRNLVFLRVIDEKIERVGSLNPGSASTADNLLFIWSPCGRYFFWNTKSGAGDGVWINEIHRFVEGEASGSDTLINTNTLFVQEIGDWSPDGTMILVPLKNQKKTKLIKVTNYSLMTMLDGDEVALYTTPHNGGAFNPNSLMAAVGNTGGNGSSKDLLMKFGVNSNGKLTHTFQDYRTGGTAVNGITYCNRENLLAHLNNSTSPNSIYFYKDMGTHYEQFGGNYSSPQPVSNVLHKQGGFSPDGQMFGAATVKSGKGNFNFYVRGETAFTGPAWGNALSEVSADGKSLQWTPDSKYALGSVGTKVVLFRREEDNTMTLIPGATFAATDYISHFKAQPFRTDRVTDVRSVVAAELEQSYGRQAQYWADADAAYAAFEASKSSTEE
jgi:hypothetical protein